MERKPPAVAAQSEFYDHTCGSYCGGLIIRLDSNAKKCFGTPARSKFSKSKKRQRFTFVVAKVSRIAHSPVFRLLCARFTSVAFIIVVTMPVVTAILNSHGLSNAIQKDSLEEPPQALRVI
jgi:hypothetical protein